jgi:hypothetical protein
MQPNECLRNTCSTAAPYNTLYERVNAPSMIWLRNLHYERVSDIIFIYHIRWLHDTIHFTHNNFKGRPWVATFCIIAVFHTRRTTGDQANPPHP